MWTGRIYFLAKEGGFEQFIVLMTFAVQKPLCLVSALFAGLILSSCSSSQRQVEAPARLPAYSFVPGKTAVLHTRHSKLFLNYGQKGTGDWISVYAKDGHVFLVICGLRFDTSGSGRRGEGPRWRVDGRNTRNFLVRHPTGL